MELDADLVRQRLTELAGLSRPGRRSIGNHRYRLGPVVETEVLARAERTVGAPLPRGYRHFITTIGDGGAGPYHGLIPLQEALEAMDERFGGLDSLGRDCPLTQDVDFGELAGAPGSWEEHEARLDADPQYVAHYQRLKETYTGDPWGDGRLPIAEIGCGDWLFLVVRGPRRGTVWVDGLDSSTGLYCLEIGFATLYRRWLEESLAEAQERFTPPEASYSFLRYGDNPRYRPI
ncbi:hypothetical protein GCM10010156_74060 [Planobispora rosea]|uniref:Knr4/Smi1-like domain-containing protein n=1 Tax=Planobispora rosea TaxID=35762 RepID=A0A8J3SAA6_PLARO|nr:SMI1/KNR4 family protein [Planobispora rosea]GGT05534.1 hypothetical protein GCM10010156_74060 [Planobispora rosea]GIH88945.1 hypothetical protein Pro02_73530 [Planobispora rosea]